MILRCCAVRESLCASGSSRPPPPKLSGELSSQASYVTLLFCPRLTKLVRGLWNGLRTCVCACVHASVRPCVCVCVRPCVWAQNVEICFFSVISWPILILLVLSDRAWCGLQNFYTEFWNLLIMQIYANLFKINEKCYFTVISWPILILFVLSDRAWCGLQNFYSEFWNSLIMQIYANLFKINEKCYFTVISWPILILFVLPDRAWCELQNFYTEIWNSFTMNPGLKNVSICSQQENCQISL